MTVDDLLAELRAGGDGAKEAAVTLGLLIERARRPPGSDDEDIADSLAPEFADRHFSPDEEQQAIDGLISYVSEEHEPLPLAVWALGKSADKRAAPALVSVLERTLDQPSHQHLAYQALTGMIPIGGPDVDRAIREAAERGHGQVRDGARRYLRLDDAPR
jgi:hypothetical protein